MSRRRRAREVAMQALYQCDLNPDTSDAAIRQFVAERLPDDWRAFAQARIDGVREHRTDIDALLAESAENWSLGRMAPVDLNTMRLAVYEMCFRTDVPPKVAMNEAIEIVRRFSSAESAAFVNGVLDKIAQKHLLATAANSDRPDEEPNGAR